MEKINKLSLPATIIIASIVLGGFYFITKLSDQKNNLNLDVECSKQAQSFYDWYSGKAAKSSLAFENHFNIKLKKCFVLIYSGSEDGTDYSYIDLYDANEKKHYAMYVGHNYCSISSLLTENNPKKCELDSGRIWSNGIDLTEPDIITKQPGGEQTKTEFLNLIKPFMAN